MTIDMSHRSVRPRTDLREMLREHIVGRALGCMEAAAARRQQVLDAAADAGAYRRGIRAAVSGFAGPLPAGRTAPPPEAIAVSRFGHDGFRIENVLFESFPGWQVNATVYVPTTGPGPFPAVVVPVGHSGKQFASYQLPCQYFARAGYIAVCFDPPGQAGEKRPGNDHFNDGVRDYLLGRCSCRYFIADALRCIDYLATRRDADLRRGVAMTGVSGGGTTTTFAALLDERIAVTGPACCVTPLADLDITQCYSGCPETHPFGRYAEGVDEVDLICAAAPAPCLLMAGEADEVFRIADTRRIAATAARFYAHMKVPQRFAFFVDPGGHAYALTMAREFTRFMDRWLRQQSDRALPELPDDALALLPENELRCSPRTDVNMRTLAVDEARALAAGYTRSPGAVRDAAAKTAGVKGAVRVPEAEVGDPFQVWVHDWRSVMLRPEAGIELPATFLTARDGLPAPTLLHLDDGGRHRLLHRHGPIARAIRFVDRERPVLNVLTIDLRGWGDTAPAMYPYEIAGWGSIDRYLAYATAALGDPVMAMRIRDGLATLAWLRTRPEVDPDHIALTGCGLGALAALHVAAIDGRPAGVTVWETLSSFGSLLAAEKYPWPADAFMPRVLRHYDLPELVSALPCPVSVVGLRDGAGNPACGDELACFSNAPHVSVIDDVSPESIVSAIQSHFQ